MYYADNSHETQIAVGPSIRAIGWLDDEHPFSMGSTSAEFRDRLRALCNGWPDGLEALGWPVAAGTHSCQLCGEFRAAGNIGVPGGDGLFVAPEMVAHYVDAHDYQPPQEFIEAVLKCPDPGTPAYAAAVRFSGA